MVELKVLQLLTLLASIVLLVSAEKARFDNYRVYSVKVETEEQLEVLHQLENYPDGVSFIEAPMLSHDAEIIVPPHKFADISELFESIGIESILKVKNLQNLIDDEQPKIRTAGFGWTQYYDLETIYNWLDEQLETYPNILTNLTVGTSFQNRTIRAVKLSHKPGNPTIFIESTIHAREWITVATATYFLNQLLTSTDPDIVDLAQNIDWVIVPVLNVDGYSYSHTDNRSWRKNRQPHSRLCYGVDLNRNFDTHFGVGTNPNPCAGIYPGPRAFSEPETSALANFISNLTNIKIYIAFHSYGQYLLFPYGHTADPSPNHADLTRVGQKTVAAISHRYGTKYVAGSIAATFYESTGTSQDWAFSTRNVSLSFTFEMRDRGPFYFELPADQIVPNSEEVIDGLKAMVAEARALNYF